MSPSAHFRWPFHCCEVARSSAACPRRWVPGGSGLSLVSESGLVLPVLFALLNHDCDLAPGGLARDGSPSFRNQSQKRGSPLNIKTGSHPNRKGTRLSGCFREPGPGNPGAGKARYGHRPSSAGHGDGKPPKPNAASATVKSGEQYPCEGQRSIHFPPPRGGQTSSVQVGKRLRGAGG